MDNPWTWIAGSLVLIGVTNGLTYLATKAHYEQEKRDRQSEEQAREQRSVWLRYIADTRDRMLSTLEVAEVIASGNVIRGAELAKSGVAVAPGSMNELVADPQLVHEISTTLVEVIERGWGNSRTNEWNLRLNHVGTVIRDAFRDQEQRIVAGDIPLLVGPEQVAQMNAALDRVMAAVDRVHGRTGEPTA